MYKYLGLLLILFLIFFCYCHISRLTTINNHLDIIQTSDPDPELAYELFDKHQPIVFQKELLFWKEFNKLIGKSLTEIKEVIAKKEINYTEYIKNNLEMYNLPLSYDWIIDLRNIVIDDKNGIFFIKQSNYLQVFGCVSGEFRIIIATPDQSTKLEPMINNVSTKDATELLNKEPMEINFIEIIIRKGNVVYIPYGWLYFIYNPTPSNETVIIDCLNKSIINFF